MESEFPSNSHSKKESKEEKNIESVVQGEVIQRKKPLGRRFADNFMGGDAKTATSYVIFDVLIPAAKNAVVDGFTEGIERMMFGEVRSTTRRGASRPGGHTPYNLMSGSGLIRQQEQGRQLSRRARSQHNFDEIILATRAEASEVLNRLYQIIEMYDEVSVADLYQLVGVTPVYTDGQHGWIDLTQSGISKVREGYLLNLPRPLPLD